MADSGTSPGVPKRLKAAPSVGGVRANPLLGATVCRTSLAVPPIWCG